MSVGGHFTNAGIVAWTERREPKDCAIVKALKQLGAVVFARTQEPQSFMHLETNNNIYGECVNPRNRLLTAGGSSGGEAALMALCGSAMGFGGDIGGSIRCPASYNGASQSITIQTLF
jgi:Asp-tRNA(Asn)/Glu-tRNA(Gln) amidotransferase A subunit family amidase